MGAQKCVHALVLSRGQAFGFGGRGRHRDLAAKLVGRPDFSFANAFDLGGVQRIHLAAALPVILKTHPHRQDEQLLWACVPYGDANKMVANCRLLAYDLN